MGWADLRQSCLVEIEADSEAPDVASFSYQSSRAVLTLKLTPTAAAQVGGSVNLAGIVARILGGSGYAGARPTRMTRMLPLQHPAHPTMFATEIASMQGRGPRRGVVAAHRAARAPVNWQAYDHYRTVVVFTNVKYAVKSDDPDQQSEVYRFVERHVQLGIENIIRQGNTFKWVPGVPGFAGQPIPTGFVLRARKGTVTFIWKNVNHIGLYGRTGLSWPDFIWEGVGKVNTKEFGGCDPGTLLMLQPKFVPLEVPFPVQFSSNGAFSVGIGTADMNLAYDIEFPMSYITPPLDPAFNYAAGGPGAAYKRNGHNLLPLPPGGTTQYFYPVTMDGTVGGASPYEGYDFHEMFKLLPPAA